jgi:hypothetical protein
MGFEIALNHLFKARLVNGRLPSLQAGDFILINIEAGDCMAHLGKASSCDESDVANSDDEQFHGQSLKEWKKRVIITKGALRSQLLLE